MSQEVLYWYCGAKSLLQLAVSLWTLRAHWRGEVKIIYDQPSHLDDIEHLARSLDVTTRQFGFSETRTRRHWHYVAKALLHLEKSSDQTILLDADTTIHADPSPLFPDSERGLTVTRFSNWVTTGRRTGGRLNRLHDAVQKEKWKQMVRLVQKSAWPAINTGVVAWSYGAILDDWSELTLEGSTAPTTDEVALQVALPVLKCWNVVTIEDDRWNWSPTYGVAKEPKIIHYHGRRNVRKPEGQRLWAPLAAEALAALPAEVVHQLAVSDPAGLRVATQR